MKVLKLIFKGFFNPISKHYNNRIDEKSKNKALFNKIVPCTFTGAISFTHAGCILKRSYYFFDRINPNFQREKIKVCVGGRGVAS